MYYNILLLSFIGIGYLTLNYEKLFLKLIKLQIIIEEKINKYFKNNNIYINYYTLDKFIKYDKFIPENKMLCEIKQNNIKKYIITSKEIDINTITLSKSNIFSSVELNKELDVTNECNMMVQENMELCLNNELGRIIQFIKTNNNTFEKNNYWDIITNNGDILNTNFIIFIIKDNKLIEYKE